MSNPSRICNSEVSLLIRVPGEVLSYELQLGYNYDVKGHWHGDFTGTLMDSSSWNWKVLRVVHPQATGLAVGQDVEIAVHHVRFYRAGSAGPLEVPA